MTALGAFAKHLNKLIASEKTSPTKIHDGTGISRSSLNEYLKQERAPTLDQAQRIAEFLGFTLKAMLSEEELPVQRLQAKGADPIDAQKLEAIGLLLKASPGKIDNCLHILKGAAAAKKSKASPA